MAYDNILPRAWDRFDAYLFDVDGTLINCTDATHYFAFCSALRKISGRELTLDGVIAHGNTDVGILRDALELASIPDHRWRPNLSGIRDEMCAFVQEHQCQLRTRVLPQVHEVLKHLKNNGSKLGVATGNLEGIGKLKLRTAGVLDYFDFGGWSDNYEYRSDVFRAALAKAREISKVDAAVCVVGDTPSDIRAARDNGLPVIAVATGVYSFEQLQTEEPELCLHSFGDLILTSSSS